MKNKHSTLMVITICSGLLLGCNNDNAPFVPPSTAVGPPTNIPDQNSFTLSRVKNVVEGLRYANTENPITVYVADRHNYAVPDGTLVHLLTDSGALVTNSCTTVAGACTVTWRSQLPPPPGGNGIATVLAYTLGEESFVDTNGNDKYDQGETFTHVPEPYIHSNQTGGYALGDIFIDENGNHLWDPSTGIYTGTQCVGDVTVCDRTELDVWTTTTFGDSDSFADSAYSGYTAASVTSATAGSTTPVVIQFRLADKNNIGLPDGTTITLKASAGTLADTSFTSTGGTVYTTLFTPATKAQTVIITVTAITPLNKKSTLNLTFID